MQFFDPSMMKHNILLFTFFCHNFLKLKIIIKLNASKKFRLF